MRKPALVLLPPSVDDAPTASKAVASPRIVRRQSTRIIEIEDPDPRKVVLTIIRVKGNREDKTIYRFGGERQEKSNRK